MRLSVLILPVIWISVFSLVDCYKILVTSVGASTSHNLIMYRLADLIGSHGNDVTVLHWKFNPKAKTPQLKHAKQIEYPFVKDEASMEEIQSRMDQMPWEKRSIFSIDLSILKRFKELTIGGCAEFLNDTDHPVYQHFLTEKYDVVILHMIDWCGFGMTELVKNPSRIWFSPTFMTDVMAHYSGASYPASYVPSAMFSSTDKMTLLERLKNFISVGMMRPLVEYSMYAPITKIFRDKFGADFPDITDIIRETQLYFINADPFFEYPRPLQHNIIYIGGLTMQKSEPLNLEWQKIMNETSEDGVVIFSLGSIASTKDMPFKMKTALINAFSRFPKYTFLIRLEGDLPKLPDNARIVDWIPQKDLLAHPKIRAFFTHGGYNSLTEATYTGVPLVVMPLFGDQIANVKRVENAGIGVGVDKDQLTETVIFEALTKVLEDERYDQKAKRLSHMMKEKPTSSANLAIGWVEFLAKFRTVDNLLPESRHIGVIQYYCLDVIAILIDFSDPHVVLGMQVCDQNEVNQQGFKVLTSLSVALYVYQSTSNGFNATQFMVLPSNMLAAEYIGGLNQTYGIIVAKQDDELITLNSLDVYYYYSETNISASNPFAYILTVQYQPNSSPYSTVMALPITYAAKELFIAPDIFNYPLSCEIWATQGATEVSLNGGSNVSVPAGSAENMVLSNGGTLIASSSIQVFAASPSLQYAVYPDIFLQSSVQFSVANGNNAAQLMIIAPLDSTGNILMDGRAIPALQYHSMQAKLCGILLLLVCLSATVTDVGAVSCQIAGRLGCVASCQLQNCATGYCGPDDVCRCSRCGEGGIIDIGKKK
uniref:glucuronosyltransferase n=1 Tax=Plectus sambesii TaxID=2011161 RepID=A0A914W8K3_9BILA